MIRHVLFTDDPTAVHREYLAEIARRIRKAGDRPADMADFEAWAKRMDVRPAHENPYDQAAE